MSKINILQVFVLLAGLVLVGTYVSIAEDYVSNSNSFYNNHEEYTECVDDKLEVYCSYKELDYRIDLYSDYYTCGKLYCTYEDMVMEDASCAVHEICRSIILEKYGDKK